MIFSTIAVAIIDWRSVSGAIRTWSRMYSETVAPPVRLSRIDEASYLSRAGVAATRVGRVGVLATAGTVASGAYERAVSGVDSRVEVLSQAAPLLVPLAEEGWLTGPVPEQVVARYLQPLQNSEVDALVLGCTHYPLLRGVIEQEVRRALGECCAVVDSAEATALELDALLRERDLLNSASAPGALDLMVTDIPGRFAEVASRFLGRQIDPAHVQQIDL